MEKGEDYLKLIIFVSYAHEDAALKSTLIGPLRDPSLEAAARFWDDRLLEGGRSWESDIDSNLQNSAVVLLLVTDDFLRSEYCMSMEAPAARELHELGRAKVLAVRLKRCTEDAGSLDGLPSWPDDGVPLLDQPAPEHAVAELRNRVKRLLVDHLKCDGKPNLSIFPDLSILHDRFGVVEGAPWHYYATYAVPVAAVTAVIAGPAAPILFPAAIDGVVSSVWCFILLAGMAGIVAAVLHQYLVLGRFPARLTRDAVVVGAAGGAAHGAIFGFSAGLIMRLLGLSLSLDSGSVAVMGAFCGVLMGLHVSLAFRPKLLRIFKDVGEGVPREYLYKDPRLEMMDSLYTEISLLEEKHRLEKKLQGLKAEAGTADGGGVAEFGVSEGDDVASVLEEEEDDEGEADQDKRGNERAAPALSATSETGLPSDAENPADGVESVPVPVVVFLSTADRRHGEALVSALEATGTADVVRVEIVTDEEPGVDQPAWWQRKSAEFQVLVVVLTKALLALPVHAAAASLSPEHQARSYDKPIVPIFVEGLDGFSSPFKRLQALPDGGLPVLDWPIPENAWLSIALEIRNKCLPSFAEHLKNYRGRKFLAEMERKRGREEKYRKSAVTGEDDLIREIDKFNDINELVKLPQHIMSMEFPYRIFGFDFAVGRCLTWSALLTFVAVLCFYSTRPDGPVAMVVGLSFLPTVVGAVLFGYLAAMRERSRIFWCSHRTFLEKPYFSDSTSRERSRISWCFHRTFLEKQEFSDSTWPDRFLTKSLPWARTRIRYMAARAAIPTCVVGAAVAVFVLSLGVHPGWAADNLPLIGVASWSVAGGLAHACSCRRMPKVLMAQHAPTHVDALVEWRGSAVTVRSTRVNYSRRNDGVVGKLPAPEPELIAGYSERIRVSAWDFGRAVIEATILVGIAIVSVLMTIEYFDIKRAFLEPSAFVIILFGLELLEERLYKDYRTHDLKPRVRYMYWRYRIIERIFGHQGASLYLGFEIFRFANYMMSSSYNEGYLVVLFVLLIWPYAILSRWKQLTVRSVTTHRADQRTE
jgi:hypothetical protein